MADPHIPLRDAQAADLPAILRLVRGLAADVKLPVTTTKDDLRHALFGPAPRIHAVLAERGGQVVAVAIWFATFSTFTGRANLYLEDLFVDPAHRGVGIGRALFAHLAGIVRQRGFGRMEWAVLNTNTRTQHFYQSIGAVPLTEWTIHRLSGEALAALAATEDGHHG
jgi:GNAT superfamily N-acetyltransferase